MSEPVVIVPPTVEPVSLVEAKRHLKREDTTADDPLIEGLISTAREYAEKFTGRSLAPQTLEVSFDGFPVHGDPFSLPGAPIREVLALTYTDTTGAPVTHEGFRLEANKTPALLWNAPWNAPWPVAAAFSDSTVVRYTAGYSPEDEDPQVYPLPKTFKTAMLLIIGHLYANREDTSVVKLEVLPLGAQALLAPYRINLGV